MTTSDRSAPSRCRRVAAGAFAVSAVVLGAGGIDIVHASAAPAQTPCAISDPGYPPHAAGLEIAATPVAAGESVSYSISGLVGAGTGSVAVDHGPALGSFTVTRSGTAAGTVVALGLAPGSHALEVTCPDGGTLVEAFTVAAAQAVAAPAVTPTTSASLPFTGFGTAVTVDAALTLLVGGAVLRTVGRRRARR